MATDSSKFEVFFDGKCPLCRREIDMIRRKDKQNKLLLTDISVPGFELPGHSMKRLMQEIHGRNPDGSFVTGVEVFRQIYDRIGFGMLVTPTRFPVVRQLLGLAYWGFAKLRYAHAMHRAKRYLEESCDSEACELKDASQDECPPTGV